VRENERKKGQVSGKERGRKVGRKTKVEDMKKLNWKI
jgi:hypothetical protein